MQAVTPNQELQIRLHLNAPFFPSNIHGICSIFLEYVRLILLESPSGLSNSSGVLISLSKLNREIYLLGTWCSRRLTTLNYFVNCQLYSLQLLLHFIPKLLQSSSPFANLDKVTFLSFFFTGLSQALATKCLIVFHYPILCVLHCTESQKLLIMTKKFGWLLTVGHFYVCSWNPVLFFWSRLQSNLKNLRNTFHLVEPQAYVKHEDSSWKSDRAKVLKRESITACWVMSCQE